MQSQGVLIALLLFGLHCAVSAWLIVRSRIYPWFVGALLGLAGAAYVLNSALNLIDPVLTGSLPFGRLPGFGIGDTLVFFWAMWLLIVGLDARRLSGVQTCDSSARASAREARESDTDG